MRVAFERVCSYFSARLRSHWAADTPKYFNIEPALAARTVLASFSIVQGRPSRMCEWIGMPLGFCTRAFIVRLFSGQWLSRGEAAAVLRPHRPDVRRMTRPS